MQYLIISFTYKKIDIKAREQLTFDTLKSKIDLCKKILFNDSIHEIILLSTCNRMEIIVATSDSENIESFMLSQISTSLNLETLKEYSNVYVDKNAVLHIFNVASSIDSLVIGETQISGQLKDAFRFSVENSFCATHLSRLFHFAFKCGAVVRTDTNISKHSVSIASIAVLKAKEKLKSLDNESAIVVGSGQMGTIIIKNLMANNCKVIVATRDINRAKNSISIDSDLISYINMDNLKNHLVESKLLFCATSSNVPVITKQMVSNSNIKREWFDISLPRNIDDIELDNLNIYVIDDLKNIANDNIDKRKNELNIANNIINVYVDKFYSWISSLDVNPIIKEMRSKAQNICLEELDKAIKKGFVSKENEENVKKLLHNVFNKFLHSPTILLKQLPDKEHSDTLIESIKVLFELDDEHHMINKYKCEHI
jgi:glutamyl-tRNA reductase